MNTTARMMQTKKRSTRRQGETHRPGRDDANFSEQLRRLRQEVAEGFLYAHTRANHNTGKALQVASFCYALIELLEEKGILTVAEVDERKKVVADRLVKKFNEEKIGAVYQAPEHDKYSFEKQVEIDCAERIHLCQAACCRMFGFALSRQDIREGVLHWDLGHPYMVAKDEDGYCRHLDRATYRCTAREHRPIPCRAFDCRNDKRIWLDFDNCVINPEVGDAVSWGTDHAHH